MTELDHLQIELSGTNLIEAGAGTGKTYAIVCLYLRLLLERGLLPEQILVVTYTEAATKELRGRVQSRIREAIKALETGETNDTFLKPFLAALNDSADARDTLTRALLLFDTASIYTIHGFCMRALKDNAFESGSLYDTKLVTDQKALIGELVDDFWRSRFFSPASPLLEPALYNGYTPEYFRAFIHSVLGAATVKVIPRYDDERIAHIAGNCRLLFTDLQTTWRRSGESIIDIIKNHAGLSRSEKNYRADKLPELLDGMAVFTAGDNPFALFDGFEKFSAGFMEQQRLKKQPPPEHPFFDLCQQLLCAVDERLLALHGELLDFCRKELPLRKRKLNIRFFDDLLSGLNDALSSESGSSLAGIVRAKYPAALIDEFQDTDPVQYDIFRQIYAGTGLPLFLIGDPKQAIYSFRGADIFAYLRAADETAPDRRFTLTVNRRSTSALLKGLNRIFGLNPKPFVHDAIVFHPATAPQTAGTAETDRHAHEAPLQLWYLPPAPDGKPLSAERSTALAIEATAAEIARLLREGELDGTPVEPADMAVIVRTNRQARLVQDALRALAIPSVMRSEMSVLATPEAQELCTLLQALAEPSNETKVRTALITDLLGATAHDIARLQEDETAWEQWLNLFSAWRQTWLTKGFMVMANQLMAGQGLRGRLLAYPDGERRLTNLLHCLELINNTACKQRLAPDALASWFGELTQAGQIDESSQIRLESDDKALRIVTVHLSKGLEYPVVFCPFTWASVRSASGVLTFHEQFDMVKDFGSPQYEEHKQRANEENLAEDLRLLYVALTRARKRCYLVADAAVDTGKNKGQSALAYLLRATDEAVGEEAALGMEQRLTQQMAACPEAIRVRKIEQPLLPVPPPSPALPASATRPLTMKTAINKDWRVTSFTAFTASDGRHQEQPDRDEGRTAADAALRPPEALLEKNRFSFPRGAQAGIFMHELFEKLDFADPAPDKISAHVKSCIDKHGYEQRWHGPLMAMVSDVISTPLSSPEGPFTLAGLDRGSWRSELEFFFPLRFVTSSVLADCLRQHGSHAAPDLRLVAESLDFRPVRGMLRGFMDMVFRHGGRHYILDWKSNHLGFTPEEYHQQALAKEMEHNIYQLQYLLYSVALNRYLSLRVKNYDYERHFGGVLYLFVRGVTPQTGETCGVFRDKPSKELIQSLTHCLIQAGG